MKKALLLIIPFITLISACKKDSKSDESSQATTTDTSATVLQDNIHVIDSTKYKLNADSTLTNKGVYQYTGNVQNMNIKVGDVIIGQTQNGYARKVVAIKVNGNSISFTTSQASLTDIFKDADIKFSINTDDSLSKYGVKRAGRLETTSDGSTNADDDAIAFVEGAISLKGGIHFRPNFVHEIKIKNGIPTYLDLGFKDATITGSLALTISGSQGVKIGDDKVIKQFKPFRTKIIVDGIPVIIVTSISIHAIYSFQISQTISKEIDFTHTNVISAYVHYENGEVTFPKSDPTPQDIINIQPFTNNATLNASIAIQPEFDFKVYDVLGPYFYIGLNAGANGNLNIRTSDWDFATYAWLSGTLGASASIFGFPHDFDLGSITFYSDSIRYKTPEFIGINSGNDQTGEINKVLPQPIKIQVTDTLGKPQAHVPVYFKVVTGNGYFTKDTKNNKIDSVSTITDNNGFAQTNWTLGDSLQTQTVQAAAKWGDGKLISNAPVTFTANPIIKIGDRAFGGIVFYVDNTGKHGLIVDSVDLEKNLTITQPYRHFESYPTDTTAAGAAKFIIANNSGDKTLALMCANYKGGGYTDWYLPSFAQLTQLYNVTTQIQNTISGIYWSNTETLPINPAEYSDNPIIPYSLIELNFDNGNRLNFSGLGGWLSSPESLTGNLRAVRIF